MKIIIQNQFCGPPGTGNGGYVCGVLAGALGAWPVEVTLRKPVPLETGLDIREEGGGLSLKHKDDLLATARVDALDMAVPKPPSADEAREASKNFLGYHQLEHPYQRCLVCGPARKAGDGMRIFAGTLEDGRGAATVWTPEGWQAGKDGFADTPFVMGALDCPGYFARFPDAGRHALLGRMTAEILAQPRVGEDYIVFGWPVKEEGRKHFVGTALFDNSGAAVARALSIWFPV